MAKVLADARIDEMLATAERHRLRQLARRQRHRATEEPTADHPRQTTRPYPPIVDLSTTSNAERARTAVRSRIRDALQRIEVAHPALGRHLAHSVWTGSYCVYQPDPPVDWTAGEAPHTV